MHLTDEEKKAIASLKRLAKRWPQTLWLFSASGSLNVMKFRQDGEAAMICDAVDPNYIVDYVNGIPNDGGDF